MNNTDNSVDISLEENKEDSVSAESSSVSTSKPKQKYVVLTVKDFIRYGFIGIFLMIFIVCSCVTFFYLKRYKDSADIYDKIREDVFISNEQTSEYIDNNKEYVFTVGNEIDFDTLLAINPDVTGWISIPSLGLEYPVVIGTDNEYYLRHAYNKAESYAGSIYMDYRSSRDWSDKRTIIYGHNMNDIDGSMFGNLPKYDSNKFYQKNDGNNFVYIYTTEGVRVYEIFAVTLSNINNEEIMFSLSIPDKFTISELQTQINKTALYDTGITVDDNDIVLTLYTCVRGGETENFRLIHTKYITTLKQ